MPESQGLDRGQWAEKLAAIGEHLRHAGVEATLEIIGAWPVIEAGLEGRTSVDLDVWMPGSRMDRGTLAEACAAAGLEFNPTGEVDRAYVQLVQAGIVQMPEHAPIEAGRWGGLTVTMPPPAALAAAKLVRAEPKDIADIFFLCSKYQLTRAAIAAFVETIPEARHRGTARENLVYLDARAT